MRKTGLSIIIPTCDRPALVWRAVRAAQAALPPGGEIVVVDDGVQHPLCPPPGMATPDSMQIVRSTGRTGASAARNLGAAAARGDILLFLDDDDEVLPDYPARVLQIAAQQPRAQWGYSAMEVVTYDAAGQPGAPEYYCRWREGPVRPGGVLRKKVAGLNQGFWVRAAMFRAIGGLETALRTDEDTDLCCRLLARGHEGWRTVQAGVRTHRGWVQEGQARQLTAGDLDERVNNYLTVFRRNAPSVPDLSPSYWFLATRFLRVAAKRPGQAVPAEFFSQVRNPLVHAALRVFWSVKKLANQPQRIKGH